ncbi:glycosyltransferase [Roseibacillus ishigakijimensis]|uniref:Glycosyltransferase n=1 Tax=Roseibacillus ishigakijimensis TaxID=454146 RepID=A0A934RTL2_9BACT|nr:glycosyltransferase [Roseibacillus ishigakijimensis]MBK1835198.1 glycosyltransferase [Roseibacillus ishigakijimensis]
MISTPDLSVIIPAHNEEKFLPVCLAGVGRAGEYAQLEIEVVVVLNRCTDGTERIARETGAVIVREDEANLAKIRNAGAERARAPVLVTCDADSVPHEKVFDEIWRKLQGGRFVGGGCLTVPERWSLGIVCSLGAVMPYLAWHGVSFGLFWCRREDFRAIGGFNERLLSVEDLDFAKRLRAWGRKRGLRYGTAWSPLVTSCRKFDQFGDWYLFAHPRAVWRVFRGTDREVADRYWYEVGRGKSSE